MKDFRELKVWQKRHGLTLDVYKATKSFPREEIYGLTSQMRRASASIPANIAEGCGRSGEAELARFMSISAGSAFELDDHLLLAHDLELLSSETYEKLHASVDEICRRLNAFIQSLKANR